MEAEVKPATPTEMDSGLYRKNVMKTLSQKPAKLGLKLAGSNTEKTNVLHCVLGFATEAFEFQKSMRKFLEGEQLSKIDKFGTDGPSIELGDAGYYLAAGAKVMKLKAFSSKKKVKLTGTLTQAILDFMDVAGDLLDLHKKTYYGPKMMAVEKMVRNPKTKEVGPKSVLVVDKGAEAVAWEERKAKIIALWPRAQELHAQLCFAVLGTPTGPVNLANIKKLVERYPAGTFELVAAEKKDSVKEAEVAQSPVAQATHEPATA